MELRNVKSFLMVAELGSFSHAAETMGYAQSSVTTQIQQLEKEFGVQLFERINRTVRLTREGEEFLLHAKRIIYEADSARSALLHLPEESGELRIAMAQSICMHYFPPILEAYHRKYPAVHVTLRTAGTNEMMEMLKHNEVDLVYTLDQRFYSSDIITAFEQETEVLFVTAPDHPLAGQHVTAEQLAACDFILTEKNMSYRRHLDQYMAGKRLEIVPFMQMGDTEMICRMLEHGNGVSFLPEYTVAASLASGRLACIYLKEQRFVIWQQLIYHKNKWVTPPMQAMIEMVSDEIPKHSTDFRISD